jgi:hypothetical protein
MFLPIQEFSILQRIRMFHQVRFHFGAGTYVVCRLGIRAAGDAEIANRIAVECDHRAPHSGVGKGVDAGGTGVEAVVHPFNKIGSRTKAWSIAWFDVFMTLSPLRLQAQVCTQP